MWQKWELWGLTLRVKEKLQKPAAASACVCVCASLDFSKTSSLLTFVWEFHTRWGGRGGGGGRWGWRRWRAGHGAGGSVGSSQAQQEQRAACDHRGHHQHHHGHHPFLFDTVIYPSVGLEFPLVDCTCGSRASFGGRFMFSRIVMEPFSQCHIQDSSQKSHLDTDTWKRQTRNQ